MKLLTLAFVFICNCCIAQQWQVEIGGGITGYNGDLSRSAVDFKTFGPSVTAGVKYMLPNNFIVLRAGISYGKIHADDANSKNAALISRNLNFKSDILEGMLGAEINLADPTVYDGIPYLFAGVGVFHFNPYTYDKNNTKVFLQPLATEGQGTSEYPNRFPYKTTKLFIPFGIGWKYKASERIDLIYEFGFRYISTDYLDDVSSTYADPQVLTAAHGAIAAELAYRPKSAHATPIGGIRGNPDSKDWYYMSGIKVCIKLGDVFDDNQ
jgi:hypothetical protein